MATTPWMTSRQLIAAVKRKIAIPASQNTFTDSDILAFANEEVMIAQVPAILKFHEEYFVYKVETPLVSNTSRYSIPDRAIGMRLRDLFWSDAEGNYSEMTRLNPDDKAFFQRNIGSNESIHKFFIEGNEVVLTPSVIGAPTGNLNFFIFLRPNQLVDDTRAAIIQSYSQKLSINFAAIQSGDALTISLGNNTPSPSYYTFTAVTGSPGANEFLIGTDSITTATNLSIAINMASILNLASSNGTPATANLTLTTTDLSMKLSTPSITSILIDSTYFYVNFNQLPTIWFNPDTSNTEVLFSNGALVDFLQTKPGHRTYTYDVPLQSISGNTGAFLQDDLMAFLSNGNGEVLQTLPIIVGDYICLANECIIPQIPPDLHNGLAERASARILAAQGDAQGLGVSQQKISDIEKSEGNLLDNRVDGAPLKVLNRFSLIRLGKLGPRRKY